MRFKYLLSCLGLFIGMIGEINALEKVVLQLRWDHQFQFAGYYTAQWKGYYQTAGLDVEIRSALKSKKKILNTINEVDQERADFGIGAIDIVVARDQGRPLVVLASIFQKSAAGFFFGNDTQIETLADLTQLRVARQVGSLIDIEFQAMLKSEGIKPELITPYPHSGGVSHLKAGKVDVMPGYSISSVYALKESGIQFKILSPWRYGIDFYGDSIFTRQSLIDEKPEMVQKFVQASLKGWQYALDHPEEVAHRIAQELPRQAFSLDLLKFNLFQIEGVKQLIISPIVPIGHTNPDRWRRMHLHLKSLGLAKNEIDINQFVFDPVAKNKIRQKQTQKLLLISLQVLFVILLIAVVWTFLLKKTVSRRTASLYAEITEKQRIEDALRKSQERFDLAMAASTDGLYDWNLINDEIYYSPGWKKMLGYEDNELKNEFSVWEKLTKESDVERSWKMLKDHLDGKVDRFEIEFKMKHKDGHWVDILSRAEAIFDSKGNAIRLVGTHLDLTQRKQAEEKIHASLKEKEILLHEIHHRVKNNMNVISSLLKLQAVSMSDPQVKKALLESQSRVFAMSAVHEILYQSSNLSEIDLQAYLERVTSTLIQTYALQHQDIQLRVNADQVNIALDKASPIGLIINELVSNAIKYAFPDQESGQINIDVMRLNDDQIELSVRDDGIGIEDDRIWYQTNSLGLKLVKSLVETQLDGELNHETNNGTHFKFTVRV